MSRIKVLVVDGDEQLSRFQCNLFQRVGWDTYQTTNPTSFTNVGNNIPDIVVINSSNVDGIKALVSIRDDLQSPIIVLSGFSSVVERAKYLESGASVCLNGPSRS